MKVLINSDYKALRRGEYVKANAGAGEFLLTEESDLSVGTLKEVAKTNHVKVKSKDTKSVILSTLLKHFGEIEMSEQNEKAMSDKVVEIVKAGFDAGKSDDDILVDIINDAGAKFSQAKKLFKNAIEENNLRISPADRKAAVKEFVDAAEFAPETWADYQEMLDKIVAEVDHTDAKQATSLLRAYCKANEIEIPKKTKAPVGTFRDQMFKHIVGNPEISEEDLAAWVAEKKPDSKSLEKMQLNAVAFLKFAREYYEAVA